MLEEILKSINSNLERIANAIPEKNLIIEEQFGTTGYSKIGESDFESTTKKSGPIPSAVVQNIVQSQQIQSAQPKIQEQNPMTIPSQSTAIPTSNQIEIFTQEQIALAMSNAMAVGKQDVVHDILRSFNAKCLMEIDQSNFNKIATILREAGVQV